MAVELNLAHLTNPNAGSNARGNKPEAMIWLNVGYEVTDETTGEVTFISLPFGLPLDTMEPKKVSGKNEDWKRMVQAKNQLLEHLQKAATGLKPGEESVVSALQVQLRRRADNEAPDLDENPFVSGLGAIKLAG